MKGLSFSEPMVKAWMAGRKTVTRRLIKLPEGFRPGTAYAANLENPPKWFDFYDENNTMKRIKANYLPGETVYIKETWRTYTGEDDSEYDHPSIEYKADSPGNYPGLKWKSPRFMPEWAARSHALIISVRPERVREINEVDAFLEGFRDELRGNTFFPVGAQFIEIWESMHPGSWERNDWVWRIRLEKKS